MEVRKPKIKSMKYEDFTDNEYLEKMIEELRAFLGEMQDKMQDNPYLKSRIMVQVRGHE